MHGCQISTEPHSKFMWFNIWLYVQPLKARHEYPLTNFVQACHFVPFLCLAWFNMESWGFARVSNFANLHTIEYQQNIGHGD